MPVIALREREDRVNNFSKETMDMKMVSTENLEVLNYCRSNAYCHDMGREVLNGLTSSPKSLPSKYFYDARGSALFEDICRLPEYYQTRTELSILKKAASAIMENVRRGDLIELGSGAHWKIQTLLEAVPREHLSAIRYVPVDVSESALVEASKELRALFPALNVFGIVADFTRHMEKIPMNGSKLFTFFGGTLGNFSEQEAVRFLKDIAEGMGRRDRLLIGIDMIKPKDTLEAAYNDSRGITSAFNKNVLTVINRELDANFDVADFDHVAFFNEKRERIEMHLQAARPVSVRIERLDLRLAFEEGETIHTEVSRKFSRASAEAMAERAGLAVSRWFTDGKGWFSLVELGRPSSDGDCFAPPTGKEAAC